jgi:hypothetical protein
MKFKVVLDNGTYSRYFVDDNKQVIARCPVLGMYPKSSILAQIKRVKFAHRATIEDSTPAEPPESPPYVPAIFDRD